MFPVLTIGLLLTVNVDEETPTLVTVPLPLPLPPDELIVISPLAPDKVIPVPSISEMTPVLVMSTVPVLALAVTPIPVFPVKLTYWLAAFANTAKLFFVLLNAK